MKLFIAIATILTVAAQIYGQVLEASPYANVKFIFYGDSSSDSVIFLDGNETAFSTVSTTYFDPAKPTKLHIHGWSESAQSESTLTIVNAYLTRKSEFNVVVFDWSPISLTRSVFLVPYEVHAVAQQAFLILTRLTINGFKPAQTHLSGFSFGNTIAGYVARNFKSKNAVTFPRLTVLDPPNLYKTFDPLYLINIISRVSRNDATFVDVIHTNYDQIGDKPTRGHIDFWPNNGTAQPGCQIFTFDAFKLGSEYF
jgi:Lipase